MDSTGLDILFVTETRYDMLDAGFVRYCMQKKQKKVGKHLCLAQSYLKHDYLVTGVSRSNRILIRARNINAHEN